MPHRFESRPCHRTRQPGMRCKPRAGELGGRFVAFMRPGAAHAGRAGLSPRAYPRSGRAAQKLELARKDPCCPRPGPRRLAGRETPAFEAWPRTQRELRASLVTIVHIIVTKSGNLKVLQRQTALLRSHCDPGTTPNRTMGSLPLAHKACGTTACQHSKYAAGIQRVEGVEKHKPEVTPRLKSPRPMTRVAHVPVEFRSLHSPPTACPFSRRRRVLRRDSTATRAGAAPSRAVANS